MRFFLVRGLWGLSLASLLIGLSIFWALLAHAQVLFLELKRFDFRIDDRSVQAISSIPSPRSVSGRTPGAAFADATQANPFRILNRLGGILDYTSAAEKGVLLFVTDVRGLQQSERRKKVNATLTDGTGGGLPSRVESALPIAPAVPVTKGGTPASVLPKLSLLSMWMGFVSTDAVGPYAGLKPDGNADAAFSLDIELNSYNTMTGFEIQTMEWPQHIWSTNPADRGAWGIAVAYQKAPSYLLNKPDGSVRIGIDGRVQFYLYVADPRGLARTTSRFRLVVHLADGSSYQQLIRMPAATKSVVLSDAVKPATSQRHCHM